MTEQNSYLRTKIVIISLSLLSFVLLNYYALEKISDNIVAKRYGKNISSYYVKLHCFRLVRMYTTHSKTFMSQIQNLLFYTPHPSCKVRFIHSLSQRMFTVKSVPMMHIWPVCTVYSILYIGYSLTYDRKYS